MEANEVMDFIIDDIKVHAHGLTQYDPNELQEYVRRGKQKFGTNLREIVLKFDNDYVDIEYITPTAGFNRLRRITGYLVGDVSRWNNGKRAELNDRVKHQAV